MITLEQIKAVNEKRLASALKEYKDAEKKVASISPTTPPIIRDQATTDLLFHRLNLRAMELQAEYWNGFSDGFAFATERTTDSPSTKSAMERSELLGMGPRSPSKPNGSTSAA